jgi:SAM-dependent methyltransferase
MEPQERGCSMDVRGYNRDAWDREVERGNRWTVPVGEDLVAAARRGDVHIVLTPTKPVPAAWLGALPGRDLLCLASGGGQQGPVLAAAGARVTVFDNSPQQLARDRETAARFGLDVRTVEGDMRDLSLFADETFDLVVHPVSNVFVPEIRPVWKEAHRVLRPGGDLLSGFCNPLMYLFDDAAYLRGVLDVRHRLPRSDLDDLDRLGDEARRSRLAKGEPLEFGHTLEDQIGGQVDAGFAITGLYEDRFAEEEHDLLSGYTAVFIATRASKAAGGDGT